MTNLKLAKITYPIGTKYKCANGNVDLFNRDIEKRSTKDSVFTVLGYKTYSGNIFGDNNGWIYFDGKWATIVSTSKTKPINYKYLIKLFKKLGIK